MIALEIFEALLEEGGTLAQAVAMMRADRDRLIRRRCERAVKAALFPAPESGFTASKADERVRVVQEAIVPEGAATAGGASTKGAARAALLMRSGLTPAARKVGGHIIESFNLSTGRCFPSVETLRAAAGLASERSVRRALAELEGEGLILRRIHGAGRANTYHPNWPALRSAAIEAGNQPAAINMNNPDSAPTRTLSSAIPDGRVRQNLGSKPIGESGGGGRHRARPDPRQREMLLPIANKADVAFASAGARLWQAAHGHFSGLGKTHVAAMGDIPEDVWDRATALELQRRDSGLPFLLQELATGPPQALGTG